MDRNTWVRGVTMRWRLPLFINARQHVAGLIGLLFLWPTPAASEPTASELVAAAIERTQHTVRYDGAYRVIDYPNGDVPADIGVCTDVLVRSYRALGIDLQQRIHEDMRAAFEQYPQRWGLSRPDTNIDHRRVPNLR
ncbi:MAG: DUF1287 domain-containing protein, partial [Pseudomonadota bacterium]